MAARSSLVLAILVAFSTPVSSQFISGTVLDSNNLPVAGVNIDAEDATTGDSVDLLNGGTNPDGQFLATLPGPGIYHITFKPPPPPTTSLLVGVVEDVVVVTTTHMGSINLAQGVALTGTVVGPSLAPVPGVDIDVTDATTGEKLLLANDATDLFGAFSVAIPTGDMEVDIDTHPVSQSIVLAHQQFLVSVTGDVDLGTVVLEPGFFVSAVIEDASGNGVEGADLDASDSASGDDVLTLHDNSDDNGVLQTILPAGTFDFIICPRFDDQLAASEVLSVTVAGSVNLGTLTLSPGVLLSGTVTDTNPTPVQGADVDVRIQSTGVKIPVCDDNTNASGQYAVLIPAGTYEVSFQPPTGALLGDDVHPNIVVNGPTTLDGVLGPQGTWVDVGGGSSGILGVPKLVGGGPLTPLSTLTLDLTFGPPNSIVLLWLSVTSTPINALGGTVHAFPFVDQVILPTNPVGGLFGATTFPPGVPMGTMIWFQYLCADGASPFGITLSNAVKATTP